MSKYELIEAIREYNPTATNEFLAQFDQQELQDYFNHLSDVLGERPIRLADVTVN